VVVAVVGGAADHAADNEAGEKDDERAVHCV
jgi:hypothetical protein